MDRKLALVGAVALWTLACGGLEEPPATTPAEGRAPDAPEQPRMGKRPGAAQGCEGGTHKCSDSLLLFCEQGEWNMVENCAERGDFFGCVEIGPGQADCRALNGM